MTAPGVVFTKDWVVDLVLDLAGYSSDQNLTSNCIVEPSCGDGAFLRRIAQRLCESARREGLLTISAIVNAVRAYDVDGNAVESSRSVVSDVLKAFGFTSADAAKVAKTWVSRSDFLVSDVPTAKWVVGNPPYVRASLIPREQRKSYSQSLSCVTLGTDLYIGFFQKGLESLSDDGCLCFICADRWLQNRYGSRLRAYVASDYSLDIHVRMHGVSAFEDDVSAYPAISLIRKGTGRNIRYMECAPGFADKDVDAAKTWLQGTGKSYKAANATADELPPLTGSEAIPLATPDRLRMLSDITRKHPTLADAGVKIGIGVASGCDAVYITEDHDAVERDRLLPLFFMRDWRAGRRDGKKCLINPWNDDGSLVNLADYPRLRSYYKANEGRLRARRVAKDHPDAWYRTLDKPDMTLMGREMLLFPDMAAKADPVYSDGSHYPHHNCYWMTSEDWDLRALGGLMMSDVVEAFVDAYGVKMRGSTLRFQAQYLRMVHIPAAEQVDEDTKAELVEAFNTGDRERANKASRRAYGLEKINA